MLILIISIRISNHIIENIIGLLWLSPPFPTLNQHTDLGVDSSVSSSCSGPSLSAAVVVGADPSVQSSPSGQGTGSDPPGYLWSLSLRKTSGDDSSGLGWTVRNNNIIFSLKNWITENLLISYMYMFIFILSKYKNSNSKITMTNYQLR